MGLLPLADQIADRAVQAQGTLWQSRMLSVVLGGEHELEQGAVMGCESYVGGCRGPQPNRLGRSVAEVTRTIADLGECRITLSALREGIDTATPTGRAVASIMATLAELELELGRERRAASRQSRQARGLPATKPPKLTPDSREQLRRLAATGEPVRELAAAFGIGRATAYRYLSR